MITASDLQGVSSDDAAHVLWHFGHMATGGRQPGPFTAHLIQAISRADYRNRAILRQAYPSLAGAVLAAQYNDDGINELRAIVAGGR